MPEQAPSLTRHDLEAKIVKRCWEDEEFRREFIADPGAAFTKYLQVPAGSLPHIVIHEEGPGSWHIVLPANPAYANELSEPDLERVAGAALLPNILINSRAIAMDSIVAASMLASLTASGVAASGAAVSAVVSQAKGW